MKPQPGKSSTIHTSYHTHCGLVLTANMHHDSVCKGLHHHDYIHTFNMESKMKLLFMTLLHNNTLHATAHIGK